MHLACADMYDCGSSWARSFEAVCKLQGFCTWANSVHRRLYCTPAGHYSLYGQLFLMPVEVVVKSLFTLQPGGTLNTPASMLSNSSVSEQQQARGTGAAAGAGQGPVVFSSSCLAAYMAFALAMVSPAVAKTSVLHKPTRAQMQPSHWPRAEADWPPLCTASGISSGVIIKSTAAVVLRDAVPCCAM